ncbi:MAG: hypothetical protein P1U29_03900 [Candidatus Pelagibacter bacterium]|nr:hypothetical protein [Vicingaceae bacterium]MDF1858094.1 hypothetical protein [Candidatus Pelagibacter bacterium]
MISSIFIALAVGCLLTYIYFQNIDFLEGEIILAPVHGFLIGFHYNKNEELEHEIQHTAQFSFIFIIITFVWFIERNKTL